MDPPLDSVGRIAALMRAIAASEPRGMRTVDVARVAAVPRPSAHRLLTALSKEGLIDRSSSGLWTLGPEMFLLGLGAAPRYDIRNLAQPILRQLAVSSGESASFSVRRGDETVCLLHEEGTFPVRSHVLHEGARFPLGIASAGLVVLAFMPQAEQEAYLQEVALEVNWGPQHKMNAVSQRLEAAYKNGFSVNPGLLVEGSWGMAAAVFDRDENAIGAISLSGTESRFARERQEVLGAQLLKSAFELSRRIQRQATTAAPLSVG